MSEIRSVNIGGVSYSIGTENVEYRILVYINNTWQDGVTIQRIVNGGSPVWSAQNTITSTQMNQLKTDMLGSSDGYQYAKYRFSCFLYPQGSLIRSYFVGDIWLQCNLFPLIGYYIGSIDTTPDDSYEYYILRFKIEESTLDVYIPSSGTTNMGYVLYKTGVVENGTYYADKTTVIHKYNIPEPEEEE